MEKKCKFETKNVTAGALWWRIGLMVISYFLVECFVAYLMESRDPMIFGFGALWACLLTGITWMLPRIAGRIFYGISYFAMACWGLAQTGYYAFFTKFMWFSDILYAGEGAAYAGAVFEHFPLPWWLGGIALLILGVVNLLLLPRFRKKTAYLLLCGTMSVLMIAGLALLPQLLFKRDEDIWGTRSEYAQSSSYRATYTTMYDAKTVYDICGLYQMSFRDVWKHTLYPLTPAYLREQKENIQTINAYFDKRPEHQENEMTGTLAGKNVILVLMESMDDWMITPEDTPTLTKLMDTGIQFTDFYTPGYGGARTINSEFCVNSGIYLPTTGKYVFDYVTNDFRQSIASQMTANGYTAEVFHYNNPEFYSRGVFEPALGYRAYNSFEDYTSDKNDLYSDTYLFDNEELAELFFREGPRYNFIITRSAHLSYVYNEVLSAYALRQYPEYKGMFGHEEIDCARVKAKLVDDMFARLLEELEARGELENTVIVGVTDHYTYGFKDTETLLELSGAEDTLELERTPCFIWSVNGPDVTVDKTLNTADLLPTVLNLLGIQPEFDYLGQDAFDPNYEGFAMFPDGSWASDGVVCKFEGNGKFQVLVNENNKELTEEYQQEMLDKNRQFVKISNLLLVSDYYQSK